MGHRLWRRNRSYLTGGGNEFAMEMNPVTFRRQSRWWLIALTALASLYVARLGRPMMHPAFGDDNSIYLVSAEALAHGDGYRLVNYPNAPASQQYPIGYPFLLSLILRVAPFGKTAVYAARVLTVASTLVWVELTRRLLRPVLGTWLAAGIALALTISPQVLDLAGQIMSDMPFAAILVGTLVLARRTRDKASPHRVLWHAAAVGALTGGAMLIRTIGLALVMGLGAEFVLRRRWPALIAFGAAVGVVLAPWLVWTAAHRGGTFHSYVDQNAITWRTPLRNFRDLAAHDAPAICFPPFETHGWKTFSRKLHGDWLSAMVGAIAVAAVILGWAILLRRRDAIALVLAPYIGIVLLWWWEPSRFVIPVLPLLVFCAAVGARHALSLLSISGRRLAAVGTCACVVGALMVDSVWIKNVWRHDDWGGAAAARDWAELDAGMEWLKLNSPANARIFSSYPAGVYLFTGRKTLDIDLHTDFAAIDRTADDTSPVYIYATERRNVMTGQEFGVMPVHRFQLQHPDRLTLLWASADGKDSIYRATP
jgi:hypothetical protein